MDKRHIIKDKTAVEAGYVDHPSDLGRATNHGITFATSREWQSLWPKYNWNGDMRTLPIELAYEIYDLGWWQRMRLDHILAAYPMLADRMFDFGINAGRGNCCRSFQRVLNVLNRRGRDYDDLVVDGDIGPATLRAFNAFLHRAGTEGAARLTMMMFSMQNYHYVDISEKREANEDFTNGWINRTWRDLKIYARFIAENYRRVN